MKINSIRIENFLSVKEVTVDFESFSNLVRMVGNNQDTRPHSSNGAGKSTIIEAVVFGLFGKTIRKTTDKSLKNIHTKGKCKVTLVINDDIVIERTKKPPRLAVSSEGENCTQENIQKTQKYLEQILNTNYNIFLASIVFGQQNSVNFLSSSPEEKRQIIQNFLNVSDLFKNRVAIRALKSRHNADKRVSSTLQAEALRKVEKLKIKIGKLTKEKKRGEKIFSKEKAEFVKNNSLAEMQEKERIHHELDVEYESLSYRFGFLQKSIQELQSRITRLSSEMCEYCGKISSELENRKLKLSEELSSSVLKKEELSRELKTLAEKTDKSAVPISVQDFEAIESLKTIEVERDILRAQSREQKRLVAKHMKEVATSQKKIDLVKFWELAFSEQGLVKYVIRNILDFFNERSNYYLTTLTRGVLSIEFDELLQETIVNNGGTVFFDALSGGEKKKVSLAVMLSLNDLLVLSGKERSNVIFFDEIADSLDGEGIKGLYELIKDITKQKRVFVISHNDYFTSLIEDSSDKFTIIKRNNITKIG